MEPRKYLSDAVAAPPEAPAVPSVGYPTDGSDIGAQAATSPGAYWFYQIGESLRRIIVAAGKTPNDSNLDLLLESIQQIASSNVINKVTGLVVTNNSSDPEHHIDVSAGSYGPYSLESVFTKKLDQSFAEGHGNGGMVGSLPTSGVLYIFLIAKNLDGTLDVYAETTNGTSPPVGWTVVKRIAVRITDASANLQLVNVYGNGEQLIVAPVTLVADFSLSTVGTSISAYPVSSVLSCPPNVVARMLVSFEPGAVNSLGIILTSVNQTDIAPDDTTIHTLTASSQSTRASTEISIYIGGSRQVNARRSVEPAKNFKGIITSWIEDRS